ncbi:MAG: short chain dehydrogenase [Microbacteriaceae bacterium]|nr:short chain dehydrogenase [Microbacteriaceae bacterium]
MSGNPETGNSEAGEPVTGKVWFITGSSRGFGREWATAALERGDRVAATARTVESIADLSARFGDAVLALQLDVNDRAAAFEAVAAAHKHFGRLDVVVNNAGYGHFGFIEELTEAEAREQFDTNVFGALWVTQAALPLLREQGSGHILQVSSLGGIVATYPGLGMYHASKWALEGLSQALSVEVARFGIAVTLIEPGGFDTEWSGASALRSERLGAYDEIRAEQSVVRKQTLAKGGDPAATAAAVMAIVDAEHPPLRVFFGSAPLRLVKREYAERIAEWEEWNDLAVAAQGQ